MIFLLMKIKCFTEAFADEEEEEGEEELEECIRMRICL